MLLCLHAEEDGGSAKDNLYKHLFAISVAISAVCLLLLRL